MCGPGYRCGRGFGAEEISARRDQCEEISARRDQREEISGLGGGWGERHLRSSQPRPAVHLVLLAVLVLLVLVLLVLDLLVLVVLGLPLRVFLAGSLSCPLRARLPWSASMS